MTNARFWTYVNGGPVKLTLRPGQRLHHSTGGPTDEGYSFSTECWTHEGGAVVVESGTEAKDCDGRLDHYSECFAFLPELQDGREYEDVTYPLWRDERIWQRDHQAEAAGY